MDTLSRMEEQIKEVEISHDGRVGMKWENISLRKGKSGKGGRVIICTGKVHGWCGYLYRTAEYRWSRLKKRYNFYNIAKEEGKKKKKSRWSLAQNKAPDKRCPGRIIPNCR